MLSINCCHLAIAVSFYFLNYWKPMIRWLSQLFETKVANLLQIFFKIVFLFLLLFVSHNHTHTHKWIRYAQKCACATRIFIDLSDRQTTFAIDNFLWWEYVSKLWRKSPFINRWTNCKLCCDYTSGRRSFELVCCESNYQATLSMKKEENKNNL